MKKPVAVVLAFAALALLCRGAALADVAKDPLVKAEAMMKSDDPAKTAQALVLVNSFLQAHPKDARALADRGDILEGQAKYPDADASYTAALAIEPDYSGALISRCESRRFLDRNADAIADCTAAIKLEPKASIAYSERAMAKLANGDANSAMVDANRAVALNDTDDFAYTTRARVEYQLGMYAETEKDSVSALLLYKSTGAFLLLGRSQIAQNEWSNAEETFTHILATDPTNHPSLYFRALARYKQKNDANALTDIDAYIAQLPNDGDGYMIRAQIHDGIGDDRAALADSRQALSAFQTAKSPQGAANAQHFLDLLNAAKH